MPASRNQRAGTPIRDLLPAGFGGAFGGVLVDHALGRLLALTRKCVAVARHPVVGLVASDVAAVEGRHDVARIELVGALRRLPVRELLAMCSMTPNSPCLACSLSDLGNGVVGRADDADLALDPVVDDVARPAAR